VVTAGDDQAIERRVDAIDDKERVQSHGRFVDQE
jgi:hypothetical protein